MAMAGLTSTGMMEHRRPDMVPAPCHASMIYFYIMISCFFFMT